MVCVMDVLVGRVLNHVIRVGDAIDVDCMEYEG